MCKGFVMQGIYCWHRWKFSSNSWYSNWNSWYSNWNSCTQIGNFQFKYQELQFEHQKLPKKFRRGQQWIPCIKNPVCTNFQLLTRSETEIADRECLIVYIQKTKIHGIHGILGGQSILHDFEPGYFGKYTEHDKTVGNTETRDEIYCHI